MPELKRLTLPQYDCKVPLRFDYDKGEAMTDLVRAVKGVPLVSTLDIAKGFGVEHFAILRLVQKYEPKFQSLRTFHFESQKSGGRPTSFCMLNEPQATFLVSLMRNSDLVVDFKLRLAAEFDRMKKELIRLASQGQNAEYLEQRKLGKVTRLLTTDTIKGFTEYATAQGSKNAAKYYMSLTTMENKALFLLEQKYTNLRNILDLHQLSTIKSADAIVAKALKDGMDQGLHYKDIYLLAKKRVEAFAEVIGKSPVLGMQLHIADNAKEVK
jgi:phage regulator Rha-like protein